MRARYLRTTAPTQEPVHVEALKTHLVVEHANDDALIAAYGRMARERAEELSDDYACCVAQTWTVYFDAFPECVKLYRAPVHRIASITYTDANGDAQTLAAANYSTDLYNDPALIVPAYGLTWPTTRDHVNVVAVQFEAGYLTPFTVNASTDVLTWSGRTPVDGTVVRLSNSGGVLPAPLASNTDYYVRDASGSTCKLAASSGGAAIDITSIGDGWHFVGELPGGLDAAIKIGTTALYEGRTGEMAIETLNVMRSLVSHHAFARVA